MSAHRDLRSTLARVLREPTVHFALLAAVFFGVSWLAGSRRGNVVTIDRGALALRMAEVEAGRDSPLTPEERREVEEGFVEEQVLVQEALAMGLERDPRIDDILVQKMLHVLSGEVIQPTEAELQAYFQANVERYAPEPSLTVDELVVGTDGPLPDALAEQLRRGVSPSELATDLPLRASVLEGVTRSDLASILGTPTATLVAASDPGTWVGPRATVRGQHWYRVTARAEPAAPSLRSVRERVRLDWVGEQELARLEERVAELRSRYTVEWTGGEGPS